MLKKMFLAICLLTVFSSQNVFADQNYTLGRNPNSVISNPSNTTTTTTNGFCDAFRQGFMTTGGNIGLTGSTMGVSTRSPRISIGNTMLHSFDPYMLEIDGTKYMLIKDNNDGVFNQNDILGYNDSKKNLFASLKPLDANNDNKLTGEELANANVRLVKIGADGKLMYFDKSSDYKVDNIKFISIKGLRKSWKNDGSTGNFGLFDAVVYNADKSSKIVTGIVTFETAEELQRYF
ncbi:MAG: hypothetical protein K6C94_05495 [Candidatus Gastranaerophilales bacterium]|nr:hypothetical protein [Candidatus Gastranaerophilales bacterium]